MQGNFRRYDFEASRGRLDGYLDASNDSFEEVDEIPDRSKLTYANGFYIQHCTALFIDIRGSSELPQRYTRPRLAKIYRSYISEAVAILNSDLACAEVNIVGDSVSGIFGTRLKSDIDGVFCTAARLRSMVDILNYKLEKRDIKPIQVGIGIDYGRLLMIKSGYSGSGINDVVWMGEAVNNASKLCHYGSQTWLDHPLMVSSVIYNNLSEDNRALLSYNTNRSCYHGYVVNKMMDEWLQSQKGT